MPELDLGQLQRVQRMIGQARSVGMSLSEINSYMDKPEELEAEIARRQREAMSKIGGNYEAKIRAFKERRLAITAAYVAGASLNQLGQLFDISNQTARGIVQKELPQEIAQQIARERTGKGRIWNFEQVEVMFKYFSENRGRLLEANVLVVAAELQRAARQTKEDEEMNLPGDMTQRLAP